MADEKLTIDVNTELLISDRTGEIGSPLGGTEAVATVISNLLTIPAIRDILVIGVRNPSSFNRVDKPLVVNVYDRPVALSDRGNRVYGAHFDPNFNAINVNLNDIGYLLAPKAVETGQQLISPYVRFNIGSVDDPRYISAPNSDFSTYITNDPALQSQYNASDGNFALIINTVNQTVIGTSKWLVPMDIHTIFAHELAHFSDQLINRGVIAQEGVGILLERVVGEGRSQAGSIQNVYNSVYDIRDMSAYEFNGKYPSSLWADINAARSSIGDIRSFGGSATGYTLENFYRDVSNLKLELRNAGSGNSVQPLVSLTNLDSGEIVFEAPANRAAGELGLIVGSTLGRYVGGSNPLANVLSTTVLGTAVQNFGQFISASINAGVGNRAVVKAGVSNVTVVAEDVLDNLGQELIANLRSAAVGSISSLLSLELGRALGVSGFGGELLNVGVSSVISHVLNNAVTLSQGGQAATALGGDLFHGLNAKSIFGSVDAAGNISGGLATSALAGFLGAKLGSLIISPTNTTGAVLSSVGAAAGAAAGSAGSFLAINVLTKIGWFGGPLVGSFVGFVLGALLGKLFGGKPKRPPQASQEIQLDAASGYWQLSGSEVFRAGNLELAKSMAVSAEQGLNGLINVVVGGKDIAPTANALTPKQRYRVTSGAANPIEVHTWTGSGWSSTALYAGKQADAAVDAGVIFGIRDSRIRGGNLLLKRAIYGTNQPNAPVADDLVTLVGNLQIAEDLEKYFLNPGVINHLIASDPDSPFAASWMITLLRAEELKLNEWSPSDFYGGLGGFAESFGFGIAGTGGALGRPYEELTLGFEQNALRITAAGTQGPFELLSGSNNIADPTVAARSALINNFGSNVGYTVWTGQATAGNDIGIASGNFSGVTLDDAPSGGDDIFVGSNYNDTLYGRAGWDWLDGGAGNDVLEGGDNDDVLLGGTGSDNLYGGAGNDYLSGGAGDDGIPAGAALYGGDGNDIIVGNAGYDDQLGENGDDTFIVDQDNGAWWDFYEGGSGSDTVSFERFTSGVGVDMRTDPPENYIAVIAPNTTLYPGQGVWSQQHTYFLFYQSDGNLVLYAPGYVPIWQTGTSTPNPGFAVMQGDGNLVIYNSSWQFQWASGTGGVPGSGLFIEPNGRMSIYSSDWRELWTTNTAPAHWLQTRTYGDGWYSIENLTGTSYNDILQGDNNNNIVTGLAGNDQLWGNGGNDILEGGLGADQLAGDAGSDTASYKNSSSGVIVDLSTGTALGGDASGDTFFLMENITGSKFNDELTGSGVNNALNGLGGDDRFIMTPGTDTIDGGAGFDTFQADVLLSSLLPSGTTLFPGMPVWTADGRYHLVYQHDGNLALYDQVGNVWNSGTNGTSHGHAVMQGDGNLVVYNASQVPVWYTGTGTPGAALAIDSTGRLSVRSPSGSELWSTGPATGVSIYHNGSNAFASLNHVGTSTLTSVEGYVGTMLADSISGSAADEVYEGGSGNDLLSGGGGSDTYIFGYGDNQDNITETSDGANSIVMKDGVNWRDVWITGANGTPNGNLTLGFWGTSDQIVVGSNFSYVTSGSNAGNHNHKIKTLDLGGVSAVDIDMIDWMPDNAVQGAGTTVYGGQNKADLIFAYQGDDVIFVSDNNTNQETRGNVVYAGDGNDIIYGNSGDDQYIFEVGNGFDQLFNHNGRDTVIMGPSVAADDVIYEVVATNTDSNGNVLQADLYIAIRDVNDPNRSAFSVADRIRIVDGGIKWIGIYSGIETLNTIEHVRVGGQEIDLTKANINWATGSYDDGGGYYPIALDLDGDGIELRSVEGSRITSLDADGTIRRMGWLGQDDGFLAVDRNGDGAIDRIDEISFIQDVDGAKSDLEGLAAYDDNSDGIIDSSDKRWGEFKVWQDKNQDGFGSASELVNLDEAGVQSISLKGQATGFTEADGFDNVVLATSEVKWIDKERNGNAYDVVLARLQVRTDEGVSKLVDENVAGRGVATDPLDAKLYGIQGLTEEQVKAIQGRKETPGKSNADSGRFYRVETLLGNGAAVAPTGLLEIDPGAAASLLEVAKRGGSEDPFALSDWTLSGSVKAGERDTRGDNIAFTELTFSDEQKAIFKDAQDRVASDKALAQAEEAAQAAKDATSEAMRPEIVRPTDAQLAEFAKTDSFRLLTTETDQETSAKAASDQETSAKAAMETAQPVSAETQAAAPAAFSAQPYDPATEAAEVIAPVEVPKAPVQQPAAADDVPQANEDTASSQPRAQTSGGVADSDYGVIIQIANARLVQALANFGDAPAMMANYQGLNVANDAQAAWLSVDAMPSIRGMASVA